eukprot:CAMPEP_0206583040 /NCGR_PEP_ID=MMETSP0325_2-20121206/34855_1 /ASSEMBLY_ACC=CAM_ASM_000347 /TAXON_ID=2866 /ORGANISM="Crypthecodinium cohnii, Strain Seligo" /LENGTH=63 /DNA_ID=CAMNT_0054089861 /DNA_START=159 /DNA_END=347 /DNA_ORIENTATION=-
MTDSEDWGPVQMSWEGHLPQPSWVAGAVAGTDSCSTTPCPWMGQALLFRGICREKQQKEQQTT